MSDRPIAVTGATGGLGGRVAARLAARGAHQRLVVRDPSRAPELPGAEVRRAAGHGAGEEMRAALEGAGALLLVPGAEAADRVSQHRTAVEAAVAAGVERIVYVSFVGAAPDATFLLVRDHFATEQHVRAAGLPFTFLRMSLYLDFLPGMVGSDGVIRGPAGHGRVAAVTRDDLADVATAVLLADPGAHAGATHDVTGGEALTFAEAAQVMASASGRAISFHDETLDEARASRAGAGAPEWMVAAWISTYVAIARGELATVGDAVARLAGHPPQTLGEHLRARPDALAHLTA